MVNERFMSVSGNYFSNLLNDMTKKRCGRHSHVQPTKWVL